MLRNMALLLLLVVSLCGFSTMAGQLKEQLMAMPQQYAEFDAKMGWDFAVERGCTVVSGVIQNARYANMEEIELWVSVLDSKGETVARASDFVRRLDLDEVSAFKVALPILVASGTKLKFTYKYVGSDGGNDGDAMKWMQTFESLMPAGR
jgi:hypothetical protein